MGGGLLNNCVLTRSFFFNVFRLDLLFSSGMSESEVEAIISDLLLGATDTTALSLNWALYGLASNQNVQVIQKIRNSQSEKFATHLHFK